MVNLKQSVEAYEKRLVLWALRQTHGHQAAAARLLSISERSMWYLVKKHGIAVARLPVDHDPPEPPQLPRP